MILEKKAERENNMKGRMLINQNTKHVAGTQKKRQTGRRTRQELRLTSRQN